MKKHFIKLNLIIRKLRGSVRRRDRRLRALSVEFAYRYRHHIDFRIATSTTGILALAVVGIMAWPQFAPARADQATPFLPALSTTISGGATAAIGNLTPGATAFGSANNSVSLDTTGLNGATAVLNSNSSTSTALVGSGSNSIPSISATGALSANEWGFIKSSSAPTATSDFNPIPAYAATGTNIITQDSATNDGSSSTPATASLYYGAAINYAQPSGDYAQSVLYTGTPVTVSAPTVTGVSPATVPVNNSSTTVTISGTVLDATTSVYVDFNDNGSMDSGEECTSGRVTDSTTISCTLPSYGVPRNYNLVVVTQGGSADYIVSYTEDMQDFTAAQCYNLPTFTGTNTDAPVHLTDTRDGKYYYAAKLADGNCWMLENLQLDGASMLATTDPDGNARTPVAQLDSSNSNLPSGDILTASSTAQIGAPLGTFPSAVTSGDSTYNLMDLVDPGSNNASTYHASTSSLHNSDTADYGYLYNWCAAMGGQSTACVDSGVTPTATSGDICPRGWHIPSGSSDATSEFAILNGKMAGLSGGSVSPSYYKNWSASFNGPFRGVMSGYYNSPGSGGFNFTGALGYYWSSQFDTSTLGSSRILFLGDSSDSAPGNGSSSRANGFAVRCLVTFAPTITSATATPIWGGSTLTVSGTNFVSDGKTAPTVAIGGTTVTPTNVTNTGFTVTLPSLASGTQSLVVTNAAGKSATYDLTYGITAAKVYRSDGATASCGSGSDETYCGVAGDSMTVEGTAFEDSTGAATVDAMSVNGVAANTFAIVGAGTAVFVLPTQSTTASTYNLVFHHTTFGNSTSSGTLGRDAVLYSGI